MKKIKFILYFLIISLILKFIPFAFKTVSASEVSKGECVIEVNSLRVLDSYNENKKLYPASTTKILTALTVIENFDLNKEITVPKSCVGTPGSSIYLRENERLKVIELLYGLMLRSGNDCAECLSTAFTSRNDFIALMNKTAKKCGALNSNFTNPHGLHDNNHYTTAYDLALISAKAMKNDVFKKIVSTKSIKISNDGYDYDRVLINKNKMLKSYDGCNGIKTGYTEKAGRCLVSSALKNNMEVISVVLNCPDMWNRSTILLDNAYNNYKIYQLFNRETLNNKVFKDKNGNSFTINFDKSFNYPLKEGEKDDITFKFNGKNLENFIKNPENNGVFEIFIKNKLIFSQNIFIII